MYTIAWAWLAWSVCARILKDNWHDVIVYERRNHIWGNCYDIKTDDIYYHVYWPHTFHTDEKEVWDWMNKYAQFKDYRFDLYTDIDWKEVPAPPNRNTMDALWLEKIEQTTTISKIMHTKTGKYLYEKVFKWYNMKQWGEIPSEKVLERFKIFANRDNRVHKHKYSWLPKRWRTTTFNRLLDGIDVRLWEEIQDADIRTWPIDQYFNYKHWKLEYHKTLFKIEKWKLNHDAITYPNGSVPYTRKTDYWRIAWSNKEIVGVEIPREGMVECYPVYSKENMETLERYKKEKTDTMFVGRLAKYKYQDMDQVIIDCFTLLRNQWLVL